MFERRRSQDLALPARRAASHALMALLAAALLVAAASLARAADSRSEVFTVRDVAVDATASTAAEAREHALTEGQRLAFQRLLARVTQAKDAARLPKPDDRALGDLVEGFEVQEEKNSPVRYIASLTYHFRGPAVEQLLRDSGIPFAATPSKPVLVLPVLRGKDGLALWEDPNPWRAVWSNLPPADGLVPFIVPIGDLKDIADINAQQAADGDEAKLRAITARYGAGSALVATATLKGEGGAATVSLSVSRYGGPLGDQTGVATIAAQSDESEDDLLKRAAQQVETEIAERWKQDNLLHFDQQQEATVVVPISGLQDWIKVRDRLGQIASISRASLVYLSPSEARVDLRYLGDPDQLKLALAQRDLVLSEQDGGLVLRMSGAGAGAAAQ
jgi:hypothetical protein